MIVNEDRHTSPKQRLIIIAIAIFMLFSTFALYVGIVLNAQNGQNQQNSYQQKINRFSVLLSEYQTKVNERAEENSKKYFETFKKYKSRVKAFNAASKTTLGVEDLVKGKGDLVKNTGDSEGNITSYGTNYSAYYIGWLSDETVFDSSFDSFESPTKLNDPLRGSDDMIQGWLEGIDGMRIGGVRELTIPAVMGYGSQDQGTIPANSVLKFVVMLIPKTKSIEISDELENLNQELRNYSLRAQESD